MKNRSRNSRDQKAKSASRKKAEMSELEQLRLLMEQREEATNRLVQAQTESAKNLAEVAGALGQVNGAQQDAHDVLGAVEKLVVDHDNTLIRHIEVVKQRNKERDKDQERFEGLLKTGCTSCQTVQKESTDCVLEEIKNFNEVIKQQTDSMNRLTDAMNRLIEKQVGTGKILTTAISISASVAAIFGAILMILKFISIGDPN